MKARTRTRNKKISAGRTLKGTRWYGPYELHVGYYLIKDFTEKKRDIYGLLPPSDLTLVRSRAKVCTISGIAGSQFPPGSSSRTVAYGHPARSFIKTNDLVPTAHSSRDKGNTQYVNELLSRTNPFRSTYSVPVMAKELIEIASMFKLVSGTFAGTAGGLYLNYRFGWEQFIRDIVTLHGITRVIERRLKELTSLLSSGGLRRKVELDKFSTTIDDGTVTVISSPSPLYARAKMSQKWVTTVYGTCRWFPAPGAWRDLEDMDKLLAFNHAVTSVFDLRIPSPETIWNLIPWTWLVDYFVDIGTYLGAMSNSTLASAEYCCIMRTHRCEISGTITETTAGFQASGAPGSVTDILLRKALPATPNLPSDFRLFNESQAKVILALLLKFRG